MSSIAAKSEGTSTMELLARLGFRPTTVSYGDPTLIFDFENLKYSRMDPFLDFHFVTFIGCLRRERGKFGLPFDGSTETRVRAWTCSTPV
jgi:hypothetical protein